MNYGIFLLLGSNQGDRRGNLAAARESINREIGTMARESSVFRTAAWGMEDQPDFLNQVVEISSSLQPGAMLDEILKIENKLGRRREKKWGPRVIDIDILFFGSQIVDTPLLKVPHPGIPHRRFTLAPLAEIAPDLVHPVLGRTMAELLSTCDDPLPVDRAS